MMIVATSRAFIRPGRLQSAWPLYPQMSEEREEVEQDETPAALLQHVFGRYTGISCREEGRKHLLCNHKLEAAGFHVEKAGNEGNGGDVSIYIQGRHWRFSWAAETGA